MVLTARKMKRDADQMKETISSNNGERFNKLKFKYIWVEKNCVWLCSLLFYGFNCKSSFICRFVYWDTFMLRNAKILFFFFSRKVRMGRRVLWHSSQRNCHPLKLLGQLFIKSFVLFIWTRNTFSIGFSVECHWHTENPLVHGLVNPKNLH